MSPLSAGAPLILDLSLIKHNTSLTTIFNPSAKQSTYNRW
jgi:hypothetical protein